MSPRRAAWLTALAGLLAAGLGYALATPSFDSPSIWRPIGFAAIGFFGFAAVFLQPEARSRRELVFIIWIPAILARAVLFPVEPSDDLNRYLWEGKLVAQGESPYEATADSERWTDWRDGYWERMNHRDKPTAYPPLALWSFAAIGALAYHPLAFKLAFVLADLLTLGAVLRLLRRAGLSPAYAGFYAFNPVVLVAFAGEAHFDSLMVAALAWSLLPARPSLRLGLCALGAGIKWVCLPLLPLLLPARERLSLKGALGSVLPAAAVLLLPALCFLPSLPELLRGLAEFGGSRGFNGPVHGLLHAALGLPRGSANLLVAAAFLAVLAWRWRIRGSCPVDAQFRWVLGALLLLSPTVHFWYLAWLLPFVALRPSLPWLLLSISAGAYFFVWANQASEGVWGLGPAQSLLFWLPFALACAYELWSTRLACLRARRRDDAGPSPSFGIVVPTLNAEDGLAVALESIRVQSLAAAEVVVADGGSSDRSCEIARAAGPAVRLVETERPGRGNQIAHGIEVLNTDWVLVLHADAELRPDALALLDRAVRHDPAMIGGAFGQRFDAPTAPLLLIECLNDLRALLTRTAFGDQIQFFHRETARREALMPAQPLMEDVESSWRLRGRGGFVFLNQPCRVSAGPWLRTHWRRRVRLVFRLMVRYRWQRRRGLESAARFSERLYREYYER